MQRNLFQALGLTPAFALEEAEIMAAWRKAIAVVHPDNFANRSAAERRVAEQWAGLINEAKDKLLDPVSRATWLLQARGCSVNAQTDTRMDPAFLMLQMRWGDAMEALQATPSPEALQALLAEVDEQYQMLMQTLTQTIDVAPDDNAAREAVRRLMFVQKTRKAILRLEAGQTPSPL